MLVFLTSLGLVVLFYAALYKSSMTDVWEDEDIWKN